MKKVLVLTYSQTGQLSRLVHSILGPLRESEEIEVTVETLRSTVDYPFPWPFFRFFDIFPECVYMDPPPIHPLTIDEDEEFDLIIVSYQVWFLSPSLPMTGFLRSQAAENLLRGKPVVTVIGCRNMWLMAQEKMKKELTRLGATLIDNIVLTDESPPSTTFVTTTRWMLTGKTDPLWGVFPKPGITDQAIEAAARFGHGLRRGFESGAIERKESSLQGLGAVEVNERYIASETIGHRSFQLWGKMIRTFSRQGTWQRKPFLLLYFIVLITMIMTALPVSLVIRAIFRPFRKKIIAAKKAYFEEPSGSDKSRMEAQKSES